MTSLTVGCGMRTKECKTNLLVHVGDVVNDPGACVMAPCAVGAYGLLVHVGVTTKAVLMCLIENQRGVAELTVNFLVGAQQWKYRRVVTEGQ